MPPPRARAVPVAGLILTAVGTWWLLGSAGAGPFPSPFAAGALVGLGTTLILAWALASPADAPRAERPA